MELQQVREALAQLDPNNRDHLVEIERLKTLEIELTAAEVGIEAEVQQFARIVKQEEIMDTLAQYIGGLQLVYTIKSVLENDSSLDTVGELSQQTNQLIHDLVKDHLQAELAELNQVIAEKDEKIKLLTKQSLEDRQSLDQAQSDLNATLDRNLELEKRADKAQNEIDELTGTIVELHYNRTTLEAELSEVKNQLEQTQREKVQVAPSQSVQERLEAIKNIGQKKSTPEILSAFEERMRSKGVDLPVINVPQEYPFRNETNEVVEPTVGQFQEDGLSLVGDTVISQDDEQTVEERLNDLENTVRRLEQEIIAIRG